MSLSHMEWRYVGTRTIAGQPSVAAYLDELHTLGTSATYADGSARTPGSGSANTYSKVTISNVTECINVTPPTNALDTRIMIAGAPGYTPSPSPTMHSPETYTASTLMVNLVKNAGAFTTWNSSTPFTTGQVFGWGKWGPTTNVLGNIYLWEAKEAIAVLITNSAGGSAYGFIAGAIIDPESSDTTTDGESDGRVYGVIRTGSSVTLSTTGFLQGSGFMYSAGLNNQNYAGFFSPGSASIIPFSSVFNHSSAPSATSLKTRSGRFARLALTMRSSSPDNLIGRVREVYAYSDAQLPARQTDGANVIGYAFCGSSVAQVDSLLLEHA